MRKLSPQKAFGGKVQPTEVDFHHFFTPHKTEKASVSLVDFRLLDGKIPDFFLVFKISDSVISARRGSASMSGKKVEMSVIQTAWAWNVYVGDFFTDSTFAGLLPKPWNNHHLGEEKGKMVLGHFFHPHPTYPNPRWSWILFLVQEIGFQKEWTNPLVGWGGVWWIGNLRRSH